MRAVTLCVVACSIVVPTEASSAKQPAATSVCELARNAAKLTGKRLQVEGYILSLSSHGFVLVGKRRDCASQLALRIDNVNGTDAWRKAFATSLGPKRAMLVGTVGWEKARATGGRNPSLAVEQVVYLSQREADADDF